MPFSLNQRPTTYCTSKKTQHVLFHKIFIRTTRLVDCWAYLRAENAVVELINLFPDLYRHTCTAVHIQKIHIPEVVTDVYKYFHACQTYEYSDGIQGQCHIRRFKSKK
jgi:hypothetical protein